MLCDEDKALGTGVAPKDQYFGTLRSVRSLEDRLRVIWECSRVEPLRFEMFVGYTDFER